MRTLAKTSSPTLQRLALLLATVAISGCAGSAAQQPNTVQPTATEPARIDVSSSQDFPATLAAAKSAIETRGFKTFAIVDHSAGAQSIGMQLAPATEIIFGNPKGGTPLMLADIRLGLELPLRILIYQGGDAVRIRYVDMASVAKSFGVTGQEALLKKTAGALAAIAAEAAAL